MIVNWQGWITLPKSVTKERIIGNAQVFDFEISPAEAATLLKEKQARLIDVREPWEYATTKVEGSELIPMGDVPARAHQELDPEERLLVMCHHGVRSLTVTNWLRQQGYDKVQSMRGGIDGWARTVDPKVPLY